MTKPTTVYVVLARGLAIRTCKTRQEAEAGIAATSPDKRQWLSIREITIP